MHGKSINVVDYTKYEPPDPYLQVNVHRIC
jgi:hypothetical protein